MLLRKMERQAQVYIAEPKLQALLLWADKATAGSESHIKPAAKRTAAIILALGLGCEHTTQFVPNDILHNTLTVYDTLTITIYDTLYDILERAQKLNRRLDVILDLTLDLGSEHIMYDSLSKARYIACDIASELKKIKIFNFSIDNDLVNWQTLLGYYPPYSAVEAFIKEIWQCALGLLILQFSL